MSAKTATEDENEIFSTQKLVQHRSIITDAHRKLGAPWPPLPPSFLQLPSRLHAVDPPATENEMALARKIRKPFLVPGWPEPYMNDIVRAMRLLRGARRYVEVGIFDRGNLAYMSTLLADDAIIVGIDVEAEPHRDGLLRETIKPGQTYHVVMGDSREPEIVEQVRNILGGEKIDGVFIDGGHDAFTAMHDYVNYSALVRDDGLVLFHDSLWEGDSDYKGSGDALYEIDRLDPIYLVAGDWQCHRYIRSLWRAPTWGVVGILPMDMRFVSR